MSGVDLRAILESLVRNGVDFVVVGGVAVAAHGYVRGTVDVDIVPEPGRDNLLRLRTALVELNATLPLADDRRFDPARDGPVLERRGNITLSTDFGGIDVIQQVPGVPGYDELDQAAVGADLLGVPIRVASLAHLRAMKAAAARAIDVADLENLPDD